MTGMNAVGCVFWSIETTITGEILFIPAHYPCLESHHSSQWAGRTFQDLGALLGTIMKLVSVLFMVQRMLTPEDNSHIRPLNMSFQNPITVHLCGSHRRVEPGCWDLSPISHESISEAFLYSYHKPLLLSVRSGPPSPLSQIHQTV